jgi:hypothetical protein
MDLAQAEPACDVSGLQGEGLGRINVAGQNRKKAGAAVRADKCAAELIHESLYGESDSPAGKCEWWRAGYLSGSYRRADLPMPPRNPHLTDAEWAAWKRGFWAAHMRRVFGKPVEVLGTNFAGRVDGKGQK